MPQVFVGIRELNTIFFLLFYFLDKISGIWNFRGLKSGIGHLVLEKNNNTPGS